jgi:hypothetical protein
MAYNPPNTKNEQDTAFDPEHVKAAHALEAAEQDQRDAFNRDFENPERMSKDGVPGDLSGEAREKEESPTFRNRVNSNYGGYKRQGGGKITSANASALLKKRGPMGLLITLISGGGIAGFMGLQGLLPIHIVENFISRNDTQNTSLTIRTNKILNSKLTGDTTSGCGYVKVACRFQRPSNKLLSNLEKEGVTAFDKNNDVISKKIIFANERPKSYAFVDKTGTKINVTAEEFASTLNTNAEFRAAFHNAYNTRFVSFADSIFKTVKNRFGFKTSDTLSKTSSADDANTRINETVAGNETGANSAVADGVTSEGEAVVEKELTDEAVKETGKVAKSGKGNAIGLVAGALCLVGDAPGLVIRTVRTYQMAQLVRYAALITTAAYAIKAGEATAEEVSVIGNLLTQVIDGKSAMDSFGIKNGLFGDTKANNDSYKKFSPGASVISAIGGLNQVTSSTAKKDACSVATNPATGAAIDAATSETIIAPLINIGAGVAISVVMSAILPKVIPVAVSLMSPYLKPLLKYFIGDLTQNLTGEDVGNGFSSGLLNMLGQTANALGNMALSVQDALSYNKLTDEVNIAYAQEDRATLSPLDASSPNTMLGSFVSSLMPYYSSTSSVTGVLSTIGSMVTKSFGSMFSSTSVSASTEDTGQYSMCEDPDIKNNDIAAGPFCNIIYGIPPKYLDRDPVAVVNSLVASGDIDENTGEPIDKGADVLTATGIRPDSSDSNPGGLKAWLDLCTDGASDQANNCKITDATANYALYAIDHSIQKTMDGEDTELDPTTADNSASASLTADLTDINSSSDNKNTALSYSLPIFSTVSNFFTNIVKTPAKQPSYLSYLANTSEYVSLPPKKLEGLTV